MTPWGALMREAGLTPVPGILDCRRQWFKARLADACSNKSKELHQNPSTGAPIHRVVKTEHEHGRTTEGITWAAPGEASVGRTIVLDNKLAAKRAAQHWATEKAAKFRVGVWMWWTDGLLILPNIKRHFCSMWRVNIVPDIDKCPSLHPKIFRAAIFSPLQRHLDLVNLLLIHMICPAMMKDTQRLRAWLRWHLHGAIVQHVNWPPQGSIWIHRLNVQKLGAT